MATNMKTLNGYGFDASALGGHDPSYYATSEDIQQVRREIPTELPNPNALTINGQSYDGSAAVNVTITGGDGGANIDDTTPSSTTTYSSQKIESELSALNEANAAQDAEITKRAKDADLAAVAKSGSYNDLTGKPTIPTVPTTLPNPNKLILTGAVTAEYDGSAPVIVEIPAGGSGSYTLPIASATQLGGVMPAAKTDEMTQTVGVDEAGGLWTMAGGGGLKSDLICDITTTEPVASISQDVDNKLYRMLLVYVKFQGIGGESNPDGITAGFRQKLFVTLSNGKRFGRAIDVSLIGTSNTPVWHNNFLFHFMKNAVAITLERNEQNRNNANAIKESSPLEIEDIENYTGIKKIEFTNEGGKNLLMTTGAQMKAWGLY